MYPELYPKLMPRTSAELQLCSCCIAVYYDCSSFCLIAHMCYKVFPVSAVSEWLLYKEDKEGHGN